MTRHRRLVQLVGYAVHGDVDRCLVYVAKGALNLEDRLSSVNVQPLSVLQRLIVGTGIAEGVAVLHAVLLLPVTAFLRLRAV